MLLSAIRPSQSSRLGFEHRERRRKRLYCEVYELEFLRIVGKEDRGVACMGNACAVKSLLRFRDMSQINGSQLCGYAFEIFHGIAAFEQVCCGEAFIVFDDVGNLAATERTGDVAAEEFVLRGDLVSPTFGPEGFPAPVVVFGIGQPLSDRRFMLEADEQFVNERSLGWPEDIRIDAGVDPVICIQDDACVPRCH
jgi:hypothetical protein